MYRIIDFLIFDACVHSVYLLGLGLRISWGARRARGGQAPTHAQPRASPADTLPAAGPAPLLIDASATLLPASSLK